MGATRQLGSAKTLSLEASCNVWNTVGPPSVSAPS